jgi:DNA repair exonuclease SbcCD ATPase subunit
MVSIHITHGSLEEEEIRAAVAAVMRVLIAEVAWQERCVHPERSLAGALRQVWEETGTEGAAFAGHVAGLLVALREQVREAQEAARQAQARLEGERRVRERLLQREREAHARTRERLAQLEGSLEERRLLTLQGERNDLRWRLQGVERERAALEQQIAALRAELEAQARLIARQQAEIKRWRAVQEE